MVTHLANTGDLQLFGWTASGHSLDLHTVLHEGGHLYDSSLAMHNLS